MRRTKSWIELISQTSRADKDVPSDFTQIPSSVVKYVPKVHSLCNQNKLSLLGVEAFAQQSSMC